MVAQIAELEYYLEANKKHHYETIVIITEVNCRVDWAQNSLQRENEYRSEDQRARDDQVAKLKESIWKSLQQTFMNVYGAFDQEVDMVKGFQPDIPIPSIDLDPFKFFQDGALVDNCGASS